MVLVGGSGVKIPVLPNIIQIATLTCGENNYFNVLSLAAMDLGHRACNNTRGLLTDAQ